MIFYMILLYPNLYYIVLNTLNNLKIDLAIEMRQLVTCTNVSSTRSNKYGRRL